jgi:thiol-disulfide isomerase/thioredoxin
LFLQVKIFCLVTHKHLSTMLRQLDGCGLRYFSYESRYHTSMSRAKKQQLKKDQAAAAAAAAEGGSGGRSRGLMAGGRRGGARGAAASTIDRLSALIGPTLNLHAAEPGVYDAKPGADALLEIMGLASMAAPPSPGPADLTASGPPPSKVIGLYFSAKWCPPCHKFTPLLANSYRAVRASQGVHAKHFEVVYVSCDSSKEEYDKYFGKVVGVGVFEHKTHPTVMSVCEMCVCVRLERVMMVAI